MLFIDRKLLLKIAKHSHDSFPVEACGILLGRSEGKRRIALEVLEATNILNSVSRYQIDPESLYRAFSYADDRGLDVVGFYHSHPYWSTELSEVDKDLATYARKSYVIYSIPEGELSSFFFDGSTLRREPVKILEGNRGSRRESRGPVH